MPRCTRAQPWITMLLALNTISILNGFSPTHLQYIQKQHQSTNLAIKRRKLVENQYKPTKRRPRQAKSKNDDVTDSSLQFLDLLLAPTPGTIFDPPLPIFIPVTGLAYAFIDPYTALTTCFVFALLRTSATRLILFPELPSDDIGDEGEDEELRLRNERLGVDLFCVGFAMATSLIVGEDYYPLLIGATIITAILLKAFVEEVAEEEQLTEDDKLMNRWDKRFLDQTDNSDSSN